MNKRIRKKKCRGEFQELAFNLTATYAKLSPETADELLQISGIGSKRLSMWGEDILRLVSEFIFSSV